MKKGTKKERINFRIDKDLKNILYDFCNRHKISVSGLFIHLLFQGLSNDKLSKKLVQSLANKNIQHTITEENAMYYLPKNMFRRVCDLALGQLLTTGHINRKLINKVLDNYKKQYDTFPSEIKKVLKDDFMITETKLRNDDFLFEMTAKLKFLPKKK